jgi:tetratricopeptide (TPR) repeat protein
MLAIFPTLIPIGSSPDLDFLIDPDPAAVGLMLQGQRYYRDLQFDSAYLLMREAVARDTLLALAALRGAQAASWAHLLEKADSLARLAARHATLLPPHQANLAKGLSAFYQGQADSALYFYRAALEWNPGSSEAWIAKGEVFYHLLPPGIRVPDSARAAFEKAVEIDPDFSTPQLHLAQIALHLGDTEEAERHIGELAPTSVDPSTMLGLETAVECLRGAIPPDAWDDLAFSDPEAAYLAASDLAPGARNPRCAEDGFRALLRASHRPGGGLYEWGSILGLSGILLAQGKVDEASTLFDSLQAAGTTGVQFLSLTAATVYPQFEALAWQTDSLGRRYFGEEFQHPRPGEGWSLGSFHASHGNLTDLERLSRGLDSISEEDPESLKAATYARALRGHLLLSHGDTAQAIEAFGGLDPDWRYDQITVDARQVMPFERLLLARLFLSTRHFREALVAAEIFDHPAPLVFLYFLPQSLEIRNQAAEALGWHGEAEEYQRRLSVLAGPPPVDQTISPSGDRR